MEIHATSCLAETTVLGLIDGSLSGDAAAGVEAHLAACRDCRELVSALARTGGQKIAPQTSQEEVYAEGVVLHGRFRLLRLLGEGGMGTVWAATHLVTRKDVALKIARGLVTERERHRFLREARVASALDHPGIVPVRDAFELEDGTPVLVMDLLLGRSLRDHLREHAPLAQEEVVALLRELLVALGAAHDQGVVHRDLKPENIFLVDEGGSRRLKVLDFGVAKLITGDEVRGQTTRSGEILGTPFYMAPEQAFGDKVDRRADLWAVGVIAYECLTGVRPFLGDNLGQLLKAVTTGTHRPLIEVRPDLSRSLCAHVEALLTVERVGRPATTTEVLSALDGNRRLGHPRTRPIFWIGLAATAIAALFAAWTSRPTPTRAVIASTMTPPTPAVHAAAPAPANPTPRASAPRPSHREPKPEVKSTDTKSDVRLPGGIVGTAPY